MSSRGIPLSSAKERREGRRETGEGAKILPRKTKTVIMCRHTTLYYTNPHPRPHLHPRREGGVCVRKSCGGTQLRIRVYADRTTYTCRIDDLFRHADVNFSHLFHPRHPFKPQRPQSHPSSSPFPPPSPFAVALESGSRERIERVRGVCQYSNNSVLRYSMLVHSAKRLHA